MENEKIIEVETVETKVTSNETINSDVAIGKVDHIAESIVGVLEEARIEKKTLMTPDVIKELHEYVFGDGENPFEDINTKRDNTIEDYHHRIDYIAGVVNISNPKKKLNR